MVTDIVALDRLVHDRILLPFEGATSVLRWRLLCHGRISGQGRVGSNCLGGFRLAACNSSRLFNLETCPTNTADEPLLQHLQCLFERP